MRLVNEFAPAKINLALHVTGQRPDGYHLLDSLVAFCQVGDQLTLELATKNSQSDQLLLNGEFAGDLPKTSENLIIQSAILLREVASRIGFACPPVTFSLSKILPIASGMGGGSANAAAALRGLKELWQLPETLDLKNIAIQLGADVAMCLVSKPLCASGIGDKLRLLSNMSCLNLVLINPGIPSPTAQVFLNLVKKDNKPIDWDMVGDWASILPGLRNDLQPAAITQHPVITTVLQELDHHHGCNFARMTGSGATCFGVYKTLDEAQIACRKIQATHPKWWCCATKTLT